MNYPIAEKKEKITEIFNDEIIDNYDWLRSKNWPDEIDKEIIDYLNLENKYYHDVMKSRMEIEDKIFLELKSRVKLSDISPAIRYDEYEYYHITSESSQYPIYCRKKINNDNEEIIFDQNKEASGYKFFTIGALKSSHNHKLLVYSVDTDGSEKYTIKIKDLENNKLLTDVISNTSGDVIWNKDNNIIFYTLLDENLRPTKLYYHIIGSDQKDDILLYEENEISLVVDIYQSSNEKYLFINSTNSSSNEIRYISLEKMSIPKLILKQQTNIVYDVDVHNDYFYIHINDTGKNFRLIRSKIDDLENKEEIIPHNDELYLSGFYLYKNKMVIIIRENGLDRIEISDFNYDNIEIIKFSDELYSIDVIYTNYKYNSVRFNYSSLNNPDSVIEYDFGTKQQNIIKIKEIPSGFDKNLYKVTRIFADNKGVKIPISLIYRKDKFKNDNPLYLYGYGSYGISIDPYFRSSIFTLVDRGFIYAIAHIRGGDDLGYNWYEDAKLLTKKNTFDDFVECAKYLINSNYTTKGNITISGGSAGGMLVGTAVNMEPDLFKSVIAHVPFVDVLNTMLDESLPLTPGEYFEWGNPKEEEYYNYIKSYSPYDNIRKVNYPSFYVTSGLYDPRVTYWEPAKWVAKLREYKTDNNLILFETNMEQGHKGASGRFDYLKEIAKEYNFIFKIYNIDL